MSTTSRENLKRVLNKRTTASAQAGDLVRISDGNVVASGAITPDYIGATTAVISNQTTSSGLSVSGGANFVTAEVSNRATASGLRVSGSANFVTADVSNIATVSGLVVTQSTTFNKVTQSGESPLTITNAPSGLSSPNVVTEFLEVTVNGNTRYIPLCGA